MAPSVALLSPVSAASACPHGRGLQESITKCQGEAAPQGLIRKGHLDDVELFCVHALYFSPHPTVPRIIVIRGELNEWLSEMAESIPSVAWKRPKLSH